MAPRKRRTPAEIEEVHYRHVAERLITQIKEGTAPWTQAWKPGGPERLPRNLSTGKRYRGGNMVWLSSTADRRGYRDERWGTYRQVRAAGGYVRRGQKGSPILFWQFERRVQQRDAAGKAVRDAEGKKTYRVIRRHRPLIRRFTVFNAEQCADLPKREHRDRPPEWNPHELADLALKRSGAEIEHTGEDRAYYDLRRDRIVMPFREQFPSAATYYQSALHELGHWTGHQDRMDRQTLIRGLGRGFSSRDYAREELRAEISSMITGDRLGLGHDPKRHASYVGTWAQQLAEDPKEIYRACRDAQGISDYVLERARLREPARPATERAMAATPRPEPPKEPDGQYRLFARPPRPEPPRPDRSWSPGR